MVSAMEAVRDGHMSVYRAATEFDVPRRTLSDRMNVRVAHGTNPGPKTVLTREDKRRMG